MIWPFAAKQWIEFPNRKCTRREKKKKLYTARTQRRVDDTTEKKLVTWKYEAWMLMSRDVHCTCTIIHSIHSIYVDDFHTIWILKSISVFVRVHVRKMHIFITKTTKKWHTPKKKSKWRNEKIWGNLLIRFKRAYALAIQASSKCLADINSFTKWQNNEARMLCKNEFLEWKKIKLHTHILVYL